MVSRAVVLAQLLAPVGCTTAWRDSGSFQRSTRTTLVAESTPPARVFVNNKYVGDTPLTFPLEYQQEVRKKTRKVSHWITQPGGSLFLTIISLGVYLPFSIIPVDIQTSLEPTQTFKDNEFEVGFAAEGHKGQHEKVVCTGQDKISKSAVLEKE